MGLTYNPLGAKDAGLMQRDVRVLGFFLHCRADAMSARA